MEKEYNFDNGKWLVGNCLDLMKDMPDNSVDMIITSPPYDNLRDYNGYVFDFENIAKELFRILKEGRTLVWIVNDAKINGSESLSSFKQAIYFVENCGFKLNDTMIWNKGSFSAVGALQTQYGPVFEYMFCFTKGKINCFNQLKDRKNKKFGNKMKNKTIRQKNGSVKKEKCNIETKEFGVRFNVWNSNAEMSRKYNFHPAKFPVHLIKDHILSWSNEGDTVFDCFGGSGTTAIAAENTNRKWILTEISEEYSEKAIERIKIECYGENPIIEDLENKFKEE